jgi:dimethylhistidine N-methyltransferase
VNQDVAAEARHGLSAKPKSLAPWLFYDDAGSQLFEQITALPEYYLPRAERALFAAHTDEILRALDAPLTLVELGAGTASKTAILLDALVRRQTGVLYQPIDISPSALEQARTQLERELPSVTVRPCIANYLTQLIPFEHPPLCKILALYIGSNIGNFAPTEARAILARLGDQLTTGDALLLGADLAPSRNSGKTVAMLLAAYNDTAGVTAAFNRNLLVRLNRELGANFRPERFAHQAIWNPSHSRIEMHLESLIEQSVLIPANCAGPELLVRFTAGETIHTENSYKFTLDALTALLVDAGFTPRHTFIDPQSYFAITLAEAKAPAVADA